MTGQTGRRMWRPSKVWAHYLPCFSLHAFGLGTWAWWEPLTLEFQFCEADLEQLLHLEQLALADVTLKKNSSSSSTIRWQIAYAPTSNPNQRLESFKRHFTNDDNSYAFVYENRYYRVPGMAQAQGTSSHTDLLEDIYVLRQGDDLTKVA